MGSGFSALGTELRCLDLDPDEVVLPSLVECEFDSCIRPDSIPVPLKGDRSHVHLRHFFQANADFPFKKNFRKSCHSRATKLFP